MKNAIIGYMILTLGGLVGIILGSGRGLLLLVTITCLSVLLAVLLGKVSLVGTSVVLLVFNLLIPVTVLLLIGIDAELNAPFVQLLKQFEWYRSIILCLFGVVMYLVTSRMKAKQGPP